MYNILKEMNPRRKAVLALLANGFVLKRNGKNHDIYYNDSLKRIIPLKRHDFNDNDLKYIKREIEFARNGGAQR